jgi:hypothetical protein
VATAQSLTASTDQLTQAGDEIGTHVAAGCEREVLARLGLEAGNGAPRPGWGIEPR